MTPEQEMKIILAGAKIELGKMQWFRVQSMKMLVNRLRELGLI